MFDKKSTSPKINRVQQNHSKLADRFLNTFKSLYVFQVVSEKSYSKI